MDLRHSDREIIVLRVRWYLRYKLLDDVSPNTGPD